MQFMLSFSPDVRPDRNRFVSAASKTPAASAAMP
jgi:hypothetical protein